VGSNGIVLRRKNSSRDKSVEITFCQPDKYRFKKAFLMTVGLLYDEKKSFISLKFSDLRVFKFV
jgi:hypothetical protein